MTVIVRMEHMRALKYCARGVRELAESCGIDYAAFLRDGIEAERLLEATNNDAMVQAVVEVARG